MLTGVGVTLGSEYLELGLEYTELGFEYLELEVLLFLDCEVEVFFFGVYVLFAGVLEDLTDLDLFEDGEVLIIETIQAMATIPITAIST
ncbi:hypothetical protein N9496_06745 [Akkermansiaceae bacterium]|nr:hypothetical protein [Akkermansiaceae bacterium]